MSSTKSDDLNNLIASKLMNIEGEIPSYSESVADAFEILKTLHSQGWFWRVDSVHDGVICTLQNRDRKTFSIRAPTAAQAICECAVKTIEETPT